MKANITISLDTELIERAREQKLNFSRLTETAVIEELEGKKGIFSRLPCEKCGDPSTTEIRDSKLQTLHWFCDKHAKEWYDRH